MELALYQARRRVACRNNGKRKIRVRPGCKISKRCQVVCPRTDRPRRKGNNKKMLKVKRKTVNSCDIKLGPNFVKRRCKVNSSCRIKCPRRYNYEGESQWLDYFLPNYEMEESSYKSIQSLQILLCFFIFFRTLFFSFSSFFKFFSSSDTLFHFLWS
ncbi:unnamed protein product [Acanthosepion pharaonis]|uniref:Uncharacterized protein n=1 Tax=Acanthosepion pharaonis TaxID=158019 RepID=A0A812AVM5_ACAPH|nr:unnamed protein product [Sepia pharaonis]